MLFYYLQIISQARAYLDLDLKVATDRRSAVQNTKTRARQ